MDTNVNRLAARLSESLAAIAGRGLWRPLLRLLTRGQPVTVEQLAQAAGCTLEQVRAALAEMPDTEYDEHGRVVGSGLTLRPTDHRFEVGGTALYTWCALDTLVFPTILGRTAYVTSPCHATGVPVRVTVASDRITHVDPDSAVVSIVTPEAPTSIRAAFCDHVHFFAGAQAAAPWLASHPGATVLPVAEAHDLAKPLVNALLDAATPPRCCSG
ncbi:organomercurial lyase MerB [Mycobacterium sp. SM1]|uniref:organomercurial lyase MerB n=1 Tax=Mycobacterium sp. SM1 TaxID=2816243 RepID=UPI0027DD4A83|nr:organomercurial lyase MerB [Mycobacterium sp. SM1]